jgi:hypothetical protein
VEKKRVKLVKKLKLDFVCRVLFGGVKLLKTLKLDFACRVLFRAEEILDILDGTWTLM